MRSDPLAYIIVTEQPSVQVFRMKENTHNAECKAIMSNTPSVPDMIEIVGTQRPDAINSVSSLHTPVVESPHLFHPQDVGDRYKYQQPLELQWKTFDELRGPDGGR